MGGLTLAPILVHLEGKKGGGVRILDGGPIGEKDSMYNAVPDLCGSSMGGRGFPKSSLPPQPLPHFRRKPHLAEGLRGQKPTHHGFLSENHAIVQLRSRGGRGDPKIKMEATILQSKQAPPLSSSGCHLDCFDLSQNP